MSKQRGVLCIFTKAPVPGQVKTRLIPALGKTKTTELYRSLLTRTLQTACASEIDKVRLYCTPTTAHPMFAECREKFDIELHLQIGDGLGTRMARALDDGLKEYDYALVLGCDCPSLETADLDLACSRLMAKTDLVLGPATDGGYYLLGLRSSQQRLFEHMSWGGPGVLEETRRRLRAAEIDWFELPEYPDLDVPEDLPAYRKLLAV